MTNEGKAIGRISIESTIIFWVGVSALLLPYVTFEPAAVDGTLLLASTIFLLRGGRFSKVDLILAYLYFAAFFLAAVLSEVLNRANDAKFARYLYVEAYLLFIVAVAYRVFVAYPRSIAVFFKYYCIGAVISCTIIVIIYHLAPGTDSIWRDASRIRIKGFFKDPNVLGPYLIFPGLILLHNPRLVALSPRWRIGIIPIIYVLFLTFSRASLGSFVASGLLMFSLRFIIGKSIRGYAASFCLLSILMIVLIVNLEALVSFLAGIENFRQRMAMQSYDSDRFGDILHALILGINNPFGLGPASYESMYDSLSPHNLFVAKLVDGGWIPAIIITWFCSYPAWICLKRYLASKDDLNLTLFCAFIAHIVMSMIINSHHWRHLLLMCCAVFATRAVSQRPYDCTIHKFGTIKRDALRRGFKV